MSVMLTAGRKRRKATNRKKVQVKKVGVKAKWSITTGKWVIEFGGQVYDIEFARDTMIPFVNGGGVAAMATISDEDYDVKIEFDYDGHSFSIFSDVDDERKTICNTIKIDDEDKYPEIILNISNSPEHFKNFK